MSPQPAKSPQPDTEDLKALKMLCRRGLKELDLALKLYLDNYYLSASIEEIEAFKLLLQRDDHSILALILTPPAEESTVLFSLCKKLQQMGK